MAKNPKAPARKPAASNPALRLEPVRSEEKIARILGILAIQNLKSRTEQATLLRAGGFSRAEIADILDTSENGVSVLLYQAKQKKEKLQSGSD